MMRIYAKIFITKRLILAFMCFYGAIEALQSNVGYDYWKPTRLNKTILENGTKMNVLNSVLSAGLSSQKKTANIFCFQDGLCGIFSVHPCQLFPLNVEGEDSVTCYTNIDFEALPSIYKRVTYHKLAGCYWLTTGNLTWDQSNERCKEDDGQLASLENFKSHQQLVEFGVFSGEPPKYIGLFRDGLNTEFKWLTGKVLDEPSPLGLAPNNPNIENVSSVCVNAYDNGMNDDACDASYQAICQMPLL